MGATIATLLPNTPAMYEAHFGVPMIGAVLNTINTRLDASAIAFMLQHAEAKVLLVDREFAPPELREGITHPVHATVAGASPPASTIEALERINIELTHTYGLTEVYGPATVCAKQEEWATLAPNERAVLNGRQGVPYVLEGDATVLDPERMAPVLADGETMGEIMFRGNIVMKGYLKNPSATAQAFAGGWFHSRARSSSSRLTQAPPRSSLSSTAAGCSRTSRCR